MSKYRPGSTERPKCECHDVFMYWHPDKRSSQGGGWRCRVRHNEGMKRRQNEKYRTDPEFRRSRIANAQKRRDARYALIDEVGYERGGCLDCGKPYTPKDIRLAWDHRDDEVKSFWIFAVISNQANVTLEELRAELAKCDLRCFSCHSKRHARLRAAAREAA